MPREVCIGRGIRRSFHDLPLGYSVAQLQCYSRCRIETLPPKHVASLDGAWQRLSMDDDRKSRRDAQKPPVANTWRASSALRVPAAWKRGRDEGRVLRARAGLDAFSIWFRFAKTG